MPDRQDATTHAAAGDDLSSRYEEVPYQSAAFAPSKPDNLSVIGTLMGLTPAPVDRCRVLEIGCAGGGNLLPLAQALPGSRFVGIDLSVKQVEQGRQLVRDAGLQNVELRCQDLLDFAEPEPFDYIIAHGFYSWVPAHVRNQLMLVCRQSLAQSGLAYISYNTLPGWHARRMSRDMMLFHGRSAKRSAQRVARAREIMAMASANPPPEQTPQSLAVKQLAAGVASCPDWFLEHDDLGLFNEPVYFEDFIKHAASHQLRYIGGAQPQMNVFQQLPAPLRGKLQSFTSDPIALEQYADFIWGVQYRDSVLCRNDAPASTRQGAAAIGNMHIAGCLVEQPLQPDKQKRHEVRFLNPLKNREMTASDPRTIAVLRLLGRSWPRAVSFDELLHAASEGGRTPVEASLRDFLSTQVLSAYMGDLLELWTRPTDFIAAAPSHPCVMPLARLQAAADIALTNLRHEECRFADPLVKKFITRLDGSRDRAALRGEIARIWNPKGSPAPSNSDARGPGGRSDEFLANVLATLAKHSLFINAVQCGSPS